MLDFMLAGGFGMWPVLILGGATLAIAVRSVFKPAHASTRSLLSLTMATSFAMAMAAAADLGAVMSKVPANPEWAHSPDLALIVMTGVGESTSPTILGCLMLALAWVVAAFAGSGHGAASKPAASTASALT